MNRINALLLLVLVAPLNAAINTQVVNYEDGKDGFQGYVAFDEAQQGPRPGVLIIHAWMGVDDHVKQAAEKLAALGYVGFAADVYGEDRRPTSQNEAAEESSKYKNDRDLFRKRVTAALKQIRKMKRVDGKRIAAIGYCFGGTGVLELARTGADVAGVVSFHGALENPRPNDSKQIKTKLLVLTGADDPYVPIEQVRAFQREMTEAEVDWQLITYSGAVHSFTHKSAGDDPSKGNAYNEAADRRSWEHMKLFLFEVFR
jgi:dienelactone hydrolase